MILDSNILGIIVSEAFGNWRLALFAEKNNPIDILLGYSSYAITLWFFILSIRAKGLGWSNSQWDGWSNLATGAVAYFVLQEPMTPTHLLGMGLIVIGLFLVGTNGTKKV
jgi:multidrug transporter EmrE-like cation transporter